MSKLVIILHMHFEELNFLQTPYDHCFLYDLCLDKGCNKDCYPTCDAAGLLFEKNRLR